MPNGLSPLGLFSNKRHYQKLYFSFRRFLYFADNQPGSSGSCKLSSRLTTYRLIKSAAAFYFLRVYIAIRAFIPVIKDSDFGK